MTTRLMTLNVNAYGEQFGPWSERRPLIVAAIHAARPDVVALQAVAVDPAVAGGLNQAEQLARDVGDDNYAVTYHCAERHADGRELGLALLSRPAPLALRAYPLSRQEGGEDPLQRVLLHATFAAPGGELQVFNAHFSWVPAQARDNVTEALARLRGVTGTIALLGDLNQGPDSEALARLRAAGLTDAWAALQPEAPGLSFIEHGVPAKRIDYLLVDTTSAPRLRAARLLLDAAGTRASDHAALVVDLDV